MERSIHHSIARISREYGLAVRVGLLPLAVGVSIVGSGCGVDKATHPAAPTVARGQTLYSASDGGAPYTFAQMYLRLANGLGQFDDKTVNDDGEFVLGVENEGAVLRYAQRHSGVVRFELLFDTAYASDTCDYLSLPPMRLGEADGKKAWLVLPSGKPLPPIQIVIRTNDGTSVRIGHGPTTAPRQVPCLI